MTLKWPFDKIGDSVKITDKITDDHRPPQFGDSCGDFSPPIGGKITAITDGARLGDSGPDRAPDCAPRRNRHPVDELADVRAEIKALQAREALLKAVLEDGGADTVGDEWLATICDEDGGARLDTKAMRAHFPAETLKAFERVSSRRVIRLTRKPVPDDL